jgi:hypothetical protein
VRRNRSSIRNIVTSYVALLRAVNVGGKTLAMSAVRQFSATIGPNPVFTAPHHSSRKT